MSPTVVFISYAHADNQSDDPAKRWLERMTQHLAPLGFGDIIAVATDKEIALGGDWHARIQADLNRAHAAVLLVSPAFLGSHYIRTNEMPVLLRHAKARGLKIIPVLLRPCMFGETQFEYPDPAVGVQKFSLASLQAAGSPAKALNEMDEGEQDRALLSVAQALLTYAQEPVSQPASEPVAPQIDIAHLPAGAEYFFGREAELADLDAAWADNGRTRVVELIAAGGVGKTALVKKWLQGMYQDSWRGARRVFGWSFYSQGVSDKRQASEDSFLAAALAWFGVHIDPAANPWDKGRKLAEALAASRTLLVLDGVEPLQYPPGPMAGKLRAPGLEALLQGLVTVGQGGLCLLSSRVPLANLAEYECGVGHPAGVVLKIDLGQLSDSDGARLLHKLGADKAGAASLAPDDRELQLASREVKGHGLTLSLLGRYLNLAFAGDIRCREQVKFQEADAETMDGHAFRVIEAYETWFAREGAKGERELAALRLFGFFDRPAGIKSLRALRTAPAIAGLTRPLVNLSGPQWQACLKRLEQCGLIYPSEDKEAIDAHPLVREYFAATLKKKQPRAWREGHRRLYEQLKDSAPHRPEGLDGLQPLYQAVAHGCLAGMHEEACAQVYLDRILRGTGSDGFYSTKMLGAIGNDLGVVACFFDEPWRRLAPSLRESIQGWLLNDAAYSLRSLGRLEEALEPMRAGAEILVKLEGWDNAAGVFSNLGELQLSLGRVAAAVLDAGRSVDYADRRQNSAQRMVSRTTLADALHQQGEAVLALKHFVEAETMQAQGLPSYPLLYSLWGFRYCELLLAGAERASWQQDANEAMVADVVARATQSLKWTEKNNAPLLDIALDHLTLARCALYAVRLPDATTEIEYAVVGLRAASQQQYIPFGLLTRAVIHHRLGDPQAAAADLNEAQQIATRGSMRLHLADIHLTRARLFHDKTELAKARTLIEECGYGRRLPELEDADAASAEWKPPSSGE